MPSVFSFKCDCGIRLSIVTEKTSSGGRKTTAIPCPTPSCNAKHSVDGDVLKVFILDDDGRSMPYDWKGVQYVRRID